MCWVLTGNIRPKTVEEIVAEKSAGMTDQQKAEYWWELNQNIFALLGKVDVPIFEIAPSDWQTLAQTQYPTLTDIKIADSKFFTTSLEGLQKILSRDWTNLVPYVAETGDCLAGESPVFVHLGGASPQLVTVESLMPPGFPIGIPYMPCHTFIADGERFAKINWIIKKPTQKKLKCVITDSVSIMTEDHPILAKEKYQDKGVFIPVSQSPFRGKVTDLSRYLKVWKTNEKSYDWGWFLGLLMAEGTVYVRPLQHHYHLRIANEDIKLLERAKRIASERIPKFDWHIDDFDSGHTRTNYGERKAPLLFLSPRLKNKEGHNGMLKNFVLNLCNALYLRGEKRVPISVLNGNKEYIRGFLDGYYAGDYDGTNSPLFATGIALLYRKLGLVPSISKYKGMNYYSIRTIKPHFDKTRIRELRIRDYTSKSNLVYDINTDSHQFCAGNLVVHNCDKFATRLYNHLCDFYKINAVVPVWGDTDQGYHGFNLAVVKDIDKFVARLVEPQNDAIFESVGPLGRYVPKVTAIELGIKRR
jgi:hypothetical protein